MKPPPRLDKLRFMGCLDSTTLNRAQNTERLIIRRHDEYYNVYLIDGRYRPMRRWVGLDPLTTQCVINAFCKGDPLGTQEGNE